MAVAGTNDDTQRRYWSETMEAAFAFMTAVREYSVHECGEPLLSLPDIAARERLQVEFSETPIADGLPRVFQLRENLIAPFCQIVRDLAGRGWVLKVEDGFRSRAMQQALALRPGVLDVIVRRLQWEKAAEVLDLDFIQRRLSVLVATCPKIGTHMSGSALDISVLQAADGREVDRGRPYLEFSEKTPMASPFVSARAQENRQVITTIFAEHGFAAYPYEFWHYSSGDAIAALVTGLPPARYGAVDLNSDGTVEPIADPLAPLNSLAELARNLEQIQLRRR